MFKEILVIDDNPDIRFLICNILKDQKFEVRSAANYDQAVLEINKRLPDLAIIDIKLDKPNKDGIDLLKIINKKNKLTPVIMISGHATVQIAVEAIRLGAYEFIEKPFSKEKILNYVNRGIESFDLKKEKDIIENKLFHSFELIGTSPSISKVKKIIEKLSITESRILISGPTGTGKELVARKIHKNSPRSKEPFIIINAALLKEKTYEKELFGEEFDDGNISFGALERANKGTLLIDEVSEIPYDTQANVLRVLIDQKFKRLNGTKDIHVNIRLISSSSKNLDELVKMNKFREDLFHRLNVMPIELFPLSTRTEDIPLLIDYFKEKLSEINGTQQPKIDIKNDSLYTYNWPGNVRELRNLVERITILSSNESKENINKVIDDILNPQSKITNEKNILEQSFLSPLKEAREHFEKEYLITQLKKHHGNISKTADFIGMERSALHRKLKSLGIKGIN
ncbi:sigma-54 dependent transcriptional regulator [Pelagibacteraceae bacterium]|jgi:two-component system nitrogen regulation response regulator NtrX|nr:sigma-54 dependent transcriptional regulator [Pelagibacteraceae bacterium]MDC0530486.1 sigma-54 dependent transcriptional regulator [Pelagibacteraceae bacterium]MDC0952841.1 sigma-54 dependent transcriptional regulator [Pelagibacteraceae bacterium]